MNEISFEIFENPRILVFECSVSLQLKRNFGGKILPKIRSHQKRPKQLYVEYFSESVVLQLQGESELHRYRGAPNPGIRILEVWGET